MNKVMILGAGRGQIPIMDLCHKYGWYVIAVSPKGDYPGLKVADKIYYANVKDKEDILEAAKNENIKAILTDQLDAGVLTAAYVAERLGIKGITSEVALKFTNKFQMRQAARKAGVAVPESICANSIEDAERQLGINPAMQYPLMIKPVDSAASRGVYKVNCFQDICNKFEESSSYSKSGKVIIEQFIHGKEYVVEAFTRDYQVTNLVVGHRDYFNVPDTFIPSATVFVDAVSANSHVEQKIKEANQALVEYFGLPFGITHGEYLYVEEQDMVYLVEIAARGGGVFISSELIPGASGVDANDLLVQEALAISSRQEIEICSGSAAYFCYLTPEGRVTKLENTEKIQTLSGVRKAFFDNIELGMQTKSIRDKSSRKGPILVQGKTKQDCYDIIAKVREVISIRVETNKGEEDILWT